MGRWAERIAAVWLQLQGWSILERRLTGRRGSGIGEVDLIVRRWNVVAFIEVKYRPSKDKAAAAISTNQQRRIVRAARAYVAGHPHLAPLSLRFDALLITPWSWPDHTVSAWDEGA